MSVRSFIDTLHFRITILFLVLLVIIFFAYIQWVDRVIYAIDYSSGEEVWAAESQDAEMDSLALLMSDMMGDSESIATALRTTGSASAPSTPN